MTGIPKIETDVPIPTVGKSRLTYPFNAMQVGDSFAVPVSKAASMRNCAHHYQKKHGHKYLTRRNRTGTQVRVWRVA